MFSSFIFGKLFYSSKEISVWHQTAFVCFSPPSRCTHVLFVVASPGSSRLLWRSVDVTHRLSNRCRSPARDLPAVVSDSSPGITRAKCLRADILYGPIKGGLFSSLVHCNSQLQPQVFFGVWRPSPASQLLSRPLHILFFCLFSWNWQRQLVAFAVCACLTLFHRCFFSASLAPLRPLFALIWLQKPSEMISGWFGLNLDLRNVFWAQIWVWFHSRQILLIYSRERVHFFYVKLHLKS